MCVWSVKRDLLSVGNVLEIGIYNEYMTNRSLLVQWLNTAVQDIGTATN